MPKVSEMIQSKFLRKEDFDEDRVMTIRTVKLEDMPGDDGQQKWVLYFREEAKGMALNVTTIRVLENAFGDDSDEWMGKKVKVYVDPNVSFGGKVVGGLRLMPPRKQAEAPKPAPVVDDGFDDDIPFKSAASARVTNGSRVTPQGDALANADARKSKMYVTEFIKSATLQDENGTRQLFDELKVDHDTTIMVWRTMKREYPTEFAFLERVTHDGNAQSGRRDRTAQRD